MARPAVVSHRTNQGQWPENTLLGIHAAIQDGADAIEVDVRATRDGALVLLHDETLERTAGDPRRVDQVTLADLRALRVRDREGRHDPQPVPTLQEAIQAIAGRCVIEVDLPMRGLEEEVAALVVAAGAQPWTWFTTHPPGDAALLRDRCPDARVYLSVAREPRLVRDLAHAIQVAADLGLAGVNPHHGSVDQPAVAAAHARGLEIGAWTVNDPAELVRLVRLGVDAVTTDYPLRLFEVIDRLQPSE
jgi:glycerophosphoryl diester phosphodiesterase